MSILEINNITKSYGNRKIFTNFSEKIEEGQIVSIIGPSGIGKSTLLKCINGIEKINFGDIIIAGQSMSEGYKNNEVFKSINMSTGIVFQEFNLFPHLSVFQNVLLPITNVLKLKKEEAKKVALQLVEELRLKNRVNAYPYQLSGGEKQRVAIARTLAIDPKIICFDEPTSALDCNLVYEVCEIIKKLAKRKKAIVIVTHDIKFAEMVSDRIIDFNKVTRK